MDNKVPHIPRQTLLLSSSVNPSEHSHRWLPGVFTQRPLRQIPGKDSHSLISTKCTLFKSYRTCDLTSQKKITMLCVRKINLITARERLTSYFELCREVFCSQQINVFETLSSYSSARYNAYFIQKVVIKCTSRHLFWCGEYCSSRCQRVKHRKIRLERSYKK